MSVVLLRCRDGEWARVVAVVVEGIAGERARSLARLMQALLPLLLLAAAAAVASWRKARKHAAAAPQLPTPRTPPPQHRRPQNEPKTVPPNTAWLPYAADPAVEPPAGVVTQVAARAPPPAAGGLRDVVAAPARAVVTPLKGEDVFVAPSAVVVGHVSIGAGSSVWYGATLRGDVNSIVIGERTNIQDNAVVHCARHTPGERERGGRGRKEAGREGGRQGGRRRQEAAGGGRRERRVVAAAVRAPRLISFCLPLSLSLPLSPSLSLTGHPALINPPFILPPARPAAASGAPRATVIGSGVTVGHGAVVHAATVGDGCLVGMGATLLDGAVLEPGSVVAAGAVVTPGTVVKSGQVFAGSPARFLRALTAEEAAFLSSAAANYGAAARAHQSENAKAFEELLLDQRIAQERAWREKSDIDAHQGIYRDPQTQAILSMR